jgi:hypothetical protein
MSQVYRTASDSPAVYTLFDDGPVCRLEERLGLMRAGQRRTGRRVLFVLLVAWLPMLLLAAMQGLAIGPSRLESFLMDFSINAHFLITVPIFLLGEAMCAAQLRTVVRQFLDAGLIKDASRSLFDAAVRNAVQVSRSGRTDAVLLALAYVHSVVALLFFMFELHEPTWRAPMRNGHAALSLAGIWYFLVAFPLYAFLLWRWFLQIALWWRFLWQVTKLDLQISPAHRDGAGGLAFLSNSIEAFAPFVFGAGAIVAGTIADFVVYEAEAPLHYQWHIIGFVVFIIILVAGPLLLFMRPLYQAKEEAVFSYGALASRQVQQVERKWLAEGALQKDIESSGADFRSVTHLGHSVTADIIKLVVIALLPLVPVLATLIPMGEVFSLLLKVLA